MSAIRCVCAALSLLVWTPAPAQHGLDFLLVQTPRLPDRGQGYVFVRQEYVSRQRSVHSSEPGLLLALTSWAAVEVHGRLAKPQGRSVRYESTTPAVHLRLGPADRPLTYGLYAEYEVAHRSGAENALHGALQVAFERARLLSAVNLTYTDEPGQTGRWGYAAGARVPVTARHGAGIELNGSLHSDGSTEALLGYYGTFSPHFTVHAGLGTGIERGPDWTARTLFIWRFR